MARRRNRGEEWKPPVLADLGGHECHEAAVASLEPASKPRLAGPPGQAAGTVGTAPSDDPGPVIGRLESSCQNDAGAARQ
jgi:hypothetical protein